MSRRWLRGLAAGAGVLFTLALSIGGLASSDGEAFVWLALIAVTPMLFLAFFQLPDALRVDTPENTLRLVAAPLTTVCMALSFFLLAVVVGASLGGWLGGAAGVVLGLLVGLQIVIAMRHLRRTLASGELLSAADQPRRREAVSRREVLSAAALSAIGFLLMALLLGGFGYLLFGRVGAIVLLCFPVLFFVCSLPLILRARKAREQES